MDKFNLGFIGSVVALVGAAVGATVLSIKRDNEKIDELKENDDICYKCKQHCGSPVKHEWGYDDRCDKMKFTFYCERCGRYFNVWR